MSQYQVIGKNVVIGKDCKIGNFVVIHDDTVIGNGVVIGDNAVIGRLPVRAKRSVTTQLVELPPLTIGDECIIGSCTVIYRGAKIGKHVLLADSCQVREKSTVEDETIVGRNVTIENGCFVGRRCKLETNAYITAFSTVEEGCFIAPMVAFTNDRNAGRHGDKGGKIEIKGPHVKRGARIGANATILPGLTLNEDCFVAAGSVVTKDVPKRMVVIGAPARVAREVPAGQWWENQ